MAKLQDKLMERIIDGKLVVELDDDIPRLYFHDVTCVDNTDSEHPITSNVMFANGNKNPVEHLPETLSSLTYAILRAFNNIGRTIVGVNVSSRTIHYINSSGELTSFQFGAFNKVTVSDRVNLLYGG